MDLISNCCTSRADYAEKKVRNDQLWIKLAAVAVRAIESQDRRSRS